jgi:GNAT superfamily N-acetyltransferase
MIPSTTLEEGDRIFCVFLCTPEPCTKIHLQIFYPNREEETVIHIRDAQEADAAEIGRLIADTYGTYNLDFVPPDEKGPFLGPFRHARSDDPAHRAAIARVIQAPMLLVAENAAGEIVGVLRGSPGRLRSLFVRGDHHRQGIGRALLERFEGASARLGSETIRLASSLYAVPFYQRMGYKKSTGVRAGWSFEGRGLRWQPMKKVLPPANRGEEW